MQRSSSASLTLQVLVHVAVQLARATGQAHLRRGRAGKGRSRLALPCP